MNSTVDTLPPLEIVTFPIGCINAKFMQQLTSLNKNVNLEKINSTQIKLQAGCSINFSGVWDIRSEQNFDQLSALNPHLRFEVISGHLVITTPMSGLIGSINSEINLQLGNWNRPGALPLGNIFDSSTEFMLPWGNFMRPDQAWMTKARFRAIPAIVRTRKRIPDVPHYVNETISYHDNLTDQRFKCATWVYAGVEVVSLVNIFTKHTYLYADIDSGLLPPLGALVTVHPFYGTVVEQDFPWPALPAPVMNGGLLIQMGPVFNVPIPARSTMVTNGGAFSINHATFELN